MVRVKSNWKPCNSSRIVESSQEQMRASCRVHHCGLATSGITTLREVVVWPKPRNSRITNPTKIHVHIWILHIIAHWTTTKLCPLPFLSGFGLVVEKRYGFKNPKHVLLFWISCPLPSLSGFGLVVEKHYNFKNTKNMFYCFEFHCRGSGVTSPNKPLRHCAIPVVLLQRATTTSGRSLKSVFLSPTLKSEASTSVINPEVWSKYLFHQSWGLKAVFITLSLIPEASISSISSIYFIKLEISY